MDDTKNIEQIPLEDISPEKQPQLFETVGVSSEKIDIAWVEKIGFWSIVWAQFKRNKIAMVGLYCILSMICIAVYAPFICLNKAFFCYFQGEGICSPWATSLFDRTFFENGVDIFFNLLMVLSPIYLLSLFIVYKKLGKRFSLHILKVITVFVIIHLSLFATVNFVGGKHGVSASYYIAIEKKIGKAPFIEKLELSPQLKNSLEKGVVAPVLKQNIEKKGYVVKENAKAIFVEKKNHWLIKENDVPKYILVKGQTKKNIWGMKTDKNGIQKMVNVEKIVPCVAVFRANDGSFSYLYPIRPFAPRTTDIAKKNPRSPNEKFWVGTDKEGHDVLTIMIYGTRVSLTIGVVAVSIYITIGILIGATAGFFGGMIDLWISRFIEIMICFPTFFLILTLAAFVKEPSIFYIMIIIGVTRWTTVARLIRGEFLRLRNIDYVQAAIALGFNKRKIIFGHVLPNALGPVLVAATFGVASSILVESTLSFLGLGDPNAPSWGVVLSYGRLSGKMWLILTPGLAIFFVVSVFNLVGEGLRDALDPKLRQ